MTGNYVYPKTAPHAYPTAAEVKVYEKLMAKIRPLNQAGVTFSAQETRELLLRDEVSVPDRVLERVLYDLGF